MFTLILTLLTRHALASVATSLECEHYLRPELAVRATADLKAYVFDRPFTYAARGRLSDEAYRRLGLPPEIKDAKWRRRLVAHVRKHRGEDKLPDLHGEFTIHALGDGKFRPVVGHRIADLTPVLWRKVNPRSTENSSDPIESLLPAELRERGPLIGRYAIGLVSDPKPTLNGGRTYYRTHFDRETEQTWLEFGLDVPCAHLATYLDEGDRHNFFWAPVSTASVEYCRIPVLTFEGTSLSDD